MEKSQADMIKAIAAENSAGELRELFETYRQYCALSFQNDRYAYEDFYYLNKDDIRFAEQVLEAEYGQDLQSDYANSEESHIAEHEGQFWFEVDEIVAEFFEELAEKSNEVIEKYAKENQKKGSALWQQYLQVKEKNPDAILMYRMGDFYEMFGADAKLASKELDLILTTRDVGLDERVPMCGVPFHAVANYVEVLQGKGHDVRLSERSMVTEQMIDKEQQRLTAEWKNDIWRIDSNGLTESLYDVAINLDHTMSEIRRRSENIAPNDVARLEAAFRLVDAYQQKDETSSHNPLISHDDLVALADARGLDYALLNLKNKQPRELSLAEIELQALEKNYDEAALLIKSHYNGAPITKKSDTLFRKFLLAVKVKEPEGLMIKSQIDGWPDWSTKYLPVDVRQAAEWLIKNGHENDAEVKSAFYDRQTSHMSDDPKAEKMDNAAIVSVAKSKGMKLESIFEQCAAPNQSALSDAQQNLTLEQSSGEEIKSDGGRDRRRRNMNANATVIGKVIRGLETKELGENAVVGKFSIVVPSGKMGEDGKGIGDNYYTVQTWDARQQAIFRDQLKVGELVAIKGNLDVNSYEKKDGKGYGVEMVINNPDVTFLGQGKNAGKATAAIVGNLACDPKSFSFENSNKTVLTVAVNNPSAKDGKPDYYDVELWNEQTKLADHLKKGSRVNVYGNLKYDVYEKEDEATGERKTGVAVKIVSPQVSFLDKKATTENVESKPKKYLPESWNQSGK